MRVSIPGFRGLYYDTDAESPAVTVALTAAGRRAPKPQGYAVQLLPYLWSFDVDLREVPNDHPIQYLHPEGARSLGELPAEQGIRQAGAELESVLQFVWAVNDEVESAAGKLVGEKRTNDGVTVEITDGSVGVDGSELETDEFDIGDESGSAGSSTETTIEIEEGPIDESPDAEEPESGEFDTDDEPESDEFDSTDDFQPDER
ncbi:hypothetical protein CV102_11140 [Natronococcus pandeyae]|uniref:Uncharacterized protein n=1 Tax=Natronococcus pandeyae TaxID=2055836 RepID=A0A8J8TSC0_9EURY|nr:hypothetical protein [Natronococcus pandeyae]TYL38362.1 hypothetical protein CV102_11140 [Natronococcus pandeyae]